MSHQHKFFTLDALRGVAALLVLTRHTSVYWGGAIFHHSYLAVDLFFMLSGFVIGHAYDQKLTSKLMTFSDFFVTRLIRLYPLYFLAAIVSGLVFSPKKAYLQGDMSVVNDYLVSLALTLFYLPSKIEGNSALFPINGVCWSLFFELIINIFYAWFRPFLSTKVLIILIIFSGCYLSLRSLSQDGIDGGFSWDFNSLVIGLIRTIYGFSFGLVLHRIFMRQAVVCDSAYKSIFVVLLASLPLALSDVDDLNGLLDCFSVLVIFPLCVLMGARFNPNKKFMFFFKLLGIVSYPIYLFHDSFGAGIFRATSALGVNIKEYSPYSGVLFVILLSSFCVFVSHIYDCPVRRRLSCFVLSRRCI